MNSRDKIAGIRARIRQTLSDYYDENEINSFIYLIFHQLLNYSKIDIQLKGEEEISPQFSSKIESIIQRLKKYEPVQYILGETEFFGLPMIVTPDVLIPRPETEELVDWIIRDNAGKNLKILDLGTGSGCIAIALAKKLPMSRVTGMDNSENALVIARKNAALNRVDIDFYMSDMLGIIDSGNPVVDIMVSNPPYIRESERKLMQANVLNFEPHQALFVPDDDPLIYYKAVATAGNQLLSDNGVIYCEINEALEEETAEVFHKSDYRDIEVRKDINGKPRMIKVK